MIGNLFQTILTQPLFNISVFFYNSIALGDFGLAIIILTVLIRIILWPLSRKSIKAQKDLQEIQPKIKEIQNKNKDNKEEQTKALLELYKTHKVNPFGGCLPILIQLPILIGLYSVFLNGLKPEYLTNLYSIVSNPGVINPLFIGLIDISIRSIPLAVLAGILQFFQAKMILPRMKSSKKGGDMAQMISKQTLYFLPVITVIISFNLPAGLPLYWATTTLFTIFQQFFIMRTKHEKGAKNKEFSQQNSL